MVTLPYRMPKILLCESMLELLSFHTLLVDMKIALKLLYIYKKNLWLHMYDKKRQQKGKRNFLELQKLEVTFKNSGAQIPKSRFTLVALSVS